MPIIKGKHLTMIKGKDCMYDKTIQCRLSYGQFEKRIKRAEIIRELAFGFCFGIAHEMMDSDSKFCMDN